MNRINPIYLGGLLLVVLMLFIFKLSSAKDELSEVKESYKTTAKLSTELSGLKDVYSQKSKTQKALQRVLRLASLRSADLKQKTKKSGVVISSESMDINALNSFMGKMLNGAYNITSLKIKRLSDEKVSLNVEIKW